MLDDKVIVRNYRLRTSGRTIIPYAVHICPTILHARTQPNHTPYLVKHRRAVFTTCRPPPARGQIRALYAPRNSVIQMGERGGKQKSCRSRDERGGFLNRSCSVLHETQLTHLPSLTILTTSSTSAIHRLPSRISHLQPPEYIFRSPQLPIHPQKPAHHIPYTRNRLTESLLNTHALSSPLRLFTDPLNTWNPRKNICLLNTPVRQQHSRSGIK
ncbi:hypothetical protein JB92DRAFT_1080595 [Gautieria morchelliformis]|nr:hypothetical protein JB92DRAFT_1080595 [Gautieria morchelliformis]